MTKKGRRFASISLLLVAVLVLATVLNVALVDASSTNASSNQTTTYRNSFKKVSNDTVDLDALRAQYLNSQVVQENTRASFDGERWVIVELEGDDLYSQYERNPRYTTFKDYCSAQDGQSAKARLEYTQQEFLTKLDRHGINYSFKYSYTTFNNGVAIKIDADAFNAIEKMTGVKAVYYSERYMVPEVAVSNNANVYTTGIYNSADLDYKGEGMVVAILDTGLDYTHEAFQTMPNEETLAWDKAHVATLLQNPELNAKGSVDQIYYNAKVPFAYDYADDDTDVYPSYSTHGTHVAGIVAGLSDYQVNKEDPTETFVGVAPQAQLVICKVFTDNLDSQYLGGADDIDILAAVSDCAEIGVDVINMSLGSSCGFTDVRSDTFTKTVYEKVRLAGISLVVAASNDYSSGFGGGNGTNLASNPDSATVGAPSTYPAALSVASINGQLSSYIIGNNDEDQVAFVTNSSDENGNTYEFVDLLYALAGKDKSQTLNFKYVTVGGVGRMTNYTATVKRQLANKEGTDGTIALVKRGDITFAEKVQNAMDNGADACIIYNNLSGVIHMSLGEVDNPIPTCSIGMDAGKKLASRATGTISVSYDYKAGPFMSDFSSWGPTPNLQLKPEITAHGGEITSAVPGGYDIYSGTSMASPNMAGAVALLRQHLKTAFPGLTGVELNARVNQVLMSTATIALNEEGNPYSPRKQGAGLAGIREAVATEGYLSVLDANGDEKDKTKLELGDDKTRTGVYTLNFVLNNITSETQTYAPYTYVMTETLASDNKTVAEKAHMLNDDCTIVYYVNGSVVSGNISVGANQSVNVKAVITLNDSAKNYIDTAFVNGMYVEGFVSLKAVGETKVTLGLPYLAFYGDWLDAPLFDYDSYEIAASEADTSVEPEDKLKASASATRVLGIYYDDQYILEMGSYVYGQPDDAVTIYPSREKIAVSIFDSPSNRTIYEVYMVYAGLLRNAAYMDVLITDATTGEVVYAQTQENVRKSYAGGGANVGGPVRLEINPLEWNLNNNSTYYVQLKGQLDYPGGENPNKNSFEFQFTVDYEAPQMLGYRIRYDAYQENKQTKYRIFMDVDVCDNQYVMDVMPCYIKSTNTGNYLSLLTEYPLAVYGQKGGVSTVSFEITDIYEDYVKAGEMYLTVEDYAMNQTLYEIHLEEDEGALEYPQKVEFAQDGQLRFTNETGTNADGSEYEIYDLSMSQYEVYKLGVTAYPNQDAFQNLTWSYPSTIKAKGNEIYAVRNTTNTAVARLTDGSRIYAQINITVSGEPKQQPIPEKITLLPAMNNEGYVVSLDVSSATLSLNPNQNVQLRASVTPWYIEDDVTFEWTTDNENVVTVDGSGMITAVKRGTSSVKVEIVGYTRRLEKRIKIVVGSEYRISRYTLYEYFGDEDVEIPDNLNIMYLDEECFQENKTIKRVVLPSTLSEVPKNAFKNCTALEEVVIPSQTIVLHESAFENCTSLRRIELKMFEDREHNVSETLHGALTIGAKTFKGCKSLNEITNQDRLTTIGNNAFEGCSALTAIDLSQLRVSGSYVFKDCKNLVNVTTSKDTNIGEYMFSGCTKMASFVYKGNSIKAGAFMGCTKLASFTFDCTGDFLGIGTFALANTAIKNISLPAGSYSIGENAFMSCSKLQTVTLNENTKLILGNASPFVGCTLFSAYVANNSQYYTVEDGILYNLDKTEVVSVPHSASSIALPSSVTRIGKGAFGSVSTLTTIDLTNIQSVGEYAFASSGLVSVTLPTTLTAMPDGMFFGCSKLTTVNGMDHVTSLGKQAFYGCKALASIDLSTVVIIGEGAFRTSGLQAVNAPVATTVGTQAFEASAVKTVELPNANTLGYRAFASISALRTVSVGAVTQMASNVFADSANITTVSFADGTTRIGDFAFYCESANNSLTTVSLPSSVIEIGRFAFAYSNNLTAINLSGVQVVGDYAFIMGAKLNNDRVVTQRLSSLESVDLANATYIGEGAFKYATFTTVDLSKAVVVGDFAFMDSTLTSVTFGALQRVGEYAFSGTKLVTVELPATLSDRRYEYTWIIYDEKGRVDNTKTRNEEAYGAGAFANISTLTSITIANGSKDFFTVDGVLYSRTPDGLVLEQYPAKKVDKRYTVLANTKLIYDRAFEGVNSLFAITFPYTVKSIGSYAFYNSSVTEYTFTSVEAPVLQATYVDATQFDKKSYEFAVFDLTLTTSLGSTQYYANFSNYVSFLDAISNATGAPLIDDFGLTLNIPKNGNGYEESLVWTKFFSTINRSASNEADDLTHAAMEAIDAIPSVDVIGSATLAQINGENGIAAVVAYARQAYNSITKSDQIAIMAEYLDTLLNAERALRERKAQLGAPVAVDKLVVAQSPLKTRYDIGEEFDKTGLVIKVLFEDGSEIDVTQGCDYDKSVFRAGDDRVVASYTVEGTLYTVEIYVNVNNNGATVDPVDPVEPVEPTNPDDNNGENSNVGAVAGGTVGGVVGLLIGCGLVFGVLYQRKRRKATESAKANDNTNIANDSADNSAEEAKEDVANETAEEVKNNSATENTNDAE